MKLLRLFAAFLLAASGAIANDDGNRIVGLWATEKAEAHVEISRREDGYHGTIVWLKEPFFSEDDVHGMGGRPKTDRENPDPALRERLIVGLEILQGLRYAGDRRWIDGTIYDPETGETYRCTLQLMDDGRLDVRGYVGISLFGRTTEWTPVLVRDSTEE